MQVTIPILVREYAGVARRDEPVSVSVPLAAGRVEASTQWMLSDPTGTPLPCQTRVLAAWSDGSVKWLQCTFLASAKARETAEFQLSPLRGDETRHIEELLPLRIERRLDEVQVETGLASFVSGAGKPWLLRSTWGGQARRMEVKVSYSDADYNQHSARLDQVEVVESGPVSAKLEICGTFKKKSRLRFRAWLTFYAGSSLVRSSLTLENPSRGQHNGGYWDLGDDASALLSALNLEILRSDELPLGTMVHWREQPDSTSKRAAIGLDTEEIAYELEIYQYSSGGENWQSRNHMNRKGQVPQRIEGYRFCHNENESFGKRAAPIMYVESPTGCFGIAPLEFWQKFPTGLSVAEDGLPLEFELHELQPGEQSTHVAWLDFGPPGDDDPCQRLAWAHVPLEVRCAPQVYAESGVVSYLPDEETAPRPELATLLHDALDGPRNFFAKREVVDEYGWRNYGDTWADHEEVHYPGPHKPIISHYNNQFDILHGFLVEYLRSGDRRWWELADPLARHVMDIDIYHTDRDKAAYNGGLFWPTTHYYDAGTSTHRSMARAMGETGTTGGGGGPGSEHNFTAGLLLYHYLTGDSRARESVIGLADWVIAMDSGEEHLLGLLSDQPTGVASLTNAPGYDGPGRGAANSIMALADGYLATGDEKYLDKADALIRRTIHPRDVIADRQLENKELRWSYSMHLQALVRYLEVITLPRPLPDREGSVLAGREGIARYVKLSVLHYARWMAEHETFALDHPEKLQYPTETWAAQELRKGNVLLMAARLAEGAEAEAFAQRGKYFLDRAWESLLSFPTRDYTRPLALVLSQGYIGAALKSCTTPLPQFNIPDGPIEPAEPQVFISQKEHIRREMKSPLGLARMALRCMSPTRWARVLRRTWLAERVRMVLRKSS